MAGLAKMVAGLAKMVAGLAKMVAGSDGKWIFMQENAGCKRCKKCKFFFSFTTISVYSARFLTLFARRKCRISVLSPLQ